MTRDLLAALRVFAGLETADETRARLRADVRRENLRAVLPLAFAAPRRRRRGVWRR